MEERRILFPSATYYPVTPPFCYQLQSYLSFKTQWLVCVCVCNSLYSYLCFNVQELRFARRFDLCFM